VTDSFPALDLEGENGREPETRDGMTHHVKHRLVREHLERGSHDIDVKAVGYSPRRYQAVCLDCEWMSNVGTGDEADKALVKHRDQTVAAAQARNG
jgi:hypothetical protein